MLGLPMAERLGGNYCETGGEPCPGVKLSIKFGKIRFRLLRRAPVGMLTLSQSESCLRSLLVEGGNA